MGPALRLLHAILLSASCSLSYALIEGTSATSALTIEDGEEGSIADFGIPILSEDMSAESLMETGSGVLDDSDVPPLDALTALEDPSAGWILPVESSLGADPDVLGELEQMAALRGASFAAGSPSTTEVVGKDVGEVGGRERVHRPHTGDGRSGRTLRGQRQS